MTAHILGRDGQPICPEALERDALSDADFWERVFINLGQPGPDDEGPDEITVSDLGECPVCQERGPCAFDDEGRALVHVEPPEVSGE